MENLNADDIKLQAVLDLLGRRGRLAMTSELLQRCLAWRGRSASRLSAGPARTQAAH